MISPRFRAPGLLLVLVLVLVRTARGEEEKSPFEFRFTERFRIETWDNTTDLSNQVDNAATYTRHLTSLGLGYTPFDRIRLFVRLTNEFRYWVKPEDREFTLNELVLDQLHLQVTKPFDLPVTATVGRQDLMFGEGFLVMDGTPLDGSRTNYFDAVRLDADLSDELRLTALAIRQEEEDDMLPVLNDKDQALLEQPESALALNLHRHREDLDHDFYWFLKRIDATAARPTDSTIHTLGARLEHRFSPDWSAAAEGAFQSGSRDREDRRAFGGYVHADYRTGWSNGLPSVLTLGAIYLTGDDAGTSRVEGFEPVFGRWPKWSDSFIYTQVKENGVGYWTNLATLYAKARIHLADDLDLELTWHRMYAPERAAPGSAFPGGTGRFRGDLGIAKLAWRIDERFTGRVIAEGFFPGDFYFDGADPAAWLQFELKYSF